MWVGLTYPLDPAGLDLSRSQFIEVWVNDFRDNRVRANDVAGTGVKLHIDLGTVSEDQRSLNDALGAEAQPDASPLRACAGAGSSCTGSRCC